MSDHCENPQHDAGRVTAANLFARLPPDWPADPMPEIRRLRALHKRKVVVIDDDPTGTQTVSNVPVLTNWNVDVLRAELRGDAAACYILSNTRGMPHAAACKVNDEIGRAIVVASGGDLSAVISRSDSTLRGHFPGEVDALARALGGIDAYVLIPAFIEGGRYTIDDIHYIAQGKDLVPVALTAFAHDATFGYTSSHLHQWIAEKMRGATHPGVICSISIEDLRRGGPERVQQQLLAVPRGSIVVVNAASRRDLEVFALGMIHTEAAGRRFLPRTAASFVPIYAGIDPHPLLPPSALAVSGPNGGLIVVGSHVPLSSVQLHALRQCTSTVAIELDVRAMLSDHAAAMVHNQAQRIDEHLRHGQDVVIFTSRVLVTGYTAEESLSMSRQVSAHVVALVRTLRVRPRYVIAKGGITSSDLATDAYDVVRAMVLGQIAPGVPVWELGAESRWPGLTYVVFPGNVGTETTLADIVTALHAV